MRKVIEKLEKKHSGEVVQEIPAIKLVRFFELKTNSPCVVLILSDTSGGDLFAGIVLM